MDGNRRRAASLIARRSRDSAHHPEEFALGDGRCRWQEPGAAIGRLLLDHGAVALELNGQFHWMDPDGVGDVFAATLDAHLERYAN